MCITKETKWHPRWCCHRKSFGASLFLSKKQISPFATPEMRQRVLLKQTQFSYNFILTPINRLFGVDGSWFKTKTGNFNFYLDSTSGQTVAMAMALRVSLCFFCDVHIWCQVSGTLLQYFQRYCLLSILPFSVAKNMQRSKLRPF